MTCSLPLGHLQYLHQKPGHSSTSAWLLPRGVTGHADAGFLSALPSYIQTLSNINLQVCTMCCFEMHERKTERKRSNSWRKGDRLYRNKTKRSSTYLWSRVLRANYTLLCNLEYKYSLITLHNQVTPYAEYTYTLKFHYINFQLICFSCYPYYATQQISCVHIHVIFTVLFTFVCIIIHLIDISRILSFHI